MKISELQSQLTYLKQRYGDIDVVACTRGPLEPDFYQTIERIEIEDFSTDGEHHAVILRLSQD
jgi:recombinational DNA repair ATPase RecF